MTTNRDWLLTEAGMVQLVEKLTAGAKFNLESDGKLRPVTFLLAMKSLEDGRQFEIPTLVIAAQGPSDQTHAQSWDAAKERYAGSVRELAQKCEAIGVITMMESWMVRPKGSTPEQIEQETRLWAGRAAECPYRTEVIFVSAEHSAFERGPKLWSADISRDHDGSAKLGEFRLWPEGVVQGRFADLLQRGGLN